VQVRLITHLTGFGVEKHDDLADAFSLLLLKIMEEDNTSQPGILFIVIGIIYDRYKSMSMLDTEPFSLDKIF